MEYDLENIDTDTMEESEKLIIEMIGSHYPELDLRKGTVIRNFLVSPDAAIYSAVAAKYDKARKLGSLSALSENPDLATVENIDAILANFNTELREGGRASGVVRVRVSSSRVYTVPSDLEIKGPEGDVFRPLSSHLAGPGENVDSDLEWGEDSAGFYFLLPVRSEEPGSGVGVSPDTVLELAANGEDFDSAETYTAISGGTDSETISEAEDRLPASLSHRAVASRTSIAGLLEDAGFDLAAIGAQGFGDAAQRRGKNNPAGIDTGGLVDIYPRSRRSPILRTVEKTGTHSGDGTYSISMRADDAPGYYMIESVVSAGDGSPEGSYLFSESRSRLPDSGRNFVHGDYTVWQTSELTVEDVERDANGSWSEEKDFRVHAYVEPELKDIQNFLDKDENRSLGFDCVARCPLMCMVSVRAIVYSSSNVSAAELETAVASYINERNFCGKISESEIIGVLHGFDISDVYTGKDGRNTFRLSGRVRGAGGSVYDLGPGTLDINRISAPEELLTPDTTVFAADMSDIDIEVRKG